VLIRREQRKLRIEELHEPSASPNIFRVTEEITMRVAGHYHAWESKKCTKYFGQEIHMNRRFCQFKRNRLEDNISKKV
jgi:hypothetical protein